MEPPSDKERQPSQVDSSIIPSKNGSRVLEVPVRRLHVCHCFPPPACLPACLGLESRQSCNLIRRPSLEFPFQIERDETSEAGGGCFTRETDCWSLLLH